jgi:hypothetical protein
VVPGRDTDGADRHPRHHGRRDRAPRAVRGGLGEGELFGILGVFADQGVNPASNEIVAEMIREKIRSIVTDPRPRRRSARRTTTSAPSGPASTRLLRDLTTGRTSGWST